MAEHSVPPFAHFAGEDPEQTAAYVEALKIELEGCRQRGDDDSAVLAELARFEAKPEKRSGRQARPAAPDAETR